MRWYKPYFSKSLNLGHLRLTLWDAGSAIGFIPKETFRYHPRCVWSDPTLFIRMPFTAVCLSVTRRGHWRVR